jgi:hypothetical protein
MANGLEMKNGISCCAASLHNWMVWFWCGATVYCCSTSSAMRPAAMVLAYHSACSSTSRRRRAVRVDWNAASLVETHYGVDAERRRPREGVQDGVDVRFRTSFDVTQQGLHSGVLSTVHVDECVEVLHGKVPNVLDAVPALDAVVDADLAVSICPSREQEPRTVWCRAPTYALGSMPASHDLASSSSSSSGCGNAHRLRITSASRIRCCH